MTTSISPSTQINGLCLTRQDQAANQLKWVAVKLQQPLYAISKPTLRAFASIEFSKAHSKIYVFAIKALGITGMALTFPIGLIGAGFYWLSDRISTNKSFTYMKGNAIEIPPSDTLNMLTMNVCNFPGGLPYFLGGVPPASHRCDAQANLILDHNPDIFVMQEAGYPASLELYQKLKDRYAHFFTRIGPNPPVMESGLFIGSKYPVKDAGFVPFADQTNILRGAFWIELPHAVVFNTHLEPGENHNEMRTMQLNKIKEKMATFNKPCFLLGDLNIDRYVPGSYEECKVGEGFHDPIPPNTPTCTLKLEAVMRGTPVPNMTEEQDDYALLRKGEHDRFDLGYELIRTYDENKPNEAITDHKAVLLKATKRF